MSYEFNPETQSLELPNPYKIENTALIAGGVAATGCGVLCVVLAAGAILQAVSLAALLVTVIAAALLSLGIWLIGKAMQQLRFFFGRHRPQSLAQTLESEAQGDSPEASHYKEALRHNALVFEEPHGSLNGLLYTVLPTLIFAPAVIQNEAQRQFQNLLGMGVILVSYLLCWALLRGAPANGWIGLVYAGLTVYCINPLRDPVTVVPFNEVSEGQSEELGRNGLVALLVLSVLVPVIAGRAAQGMPSLGGFSANGVVLFAMGMAMGSIGVFLMAMRNQLGTTPQEVGAARVVDTVTMNAHPGKLMEELDRILMDEWFSRIPNRRYTRLVPQVQEGQGAFRAEVLDETQPQPKPKTMAQDWRHALGEPYFSWLGFLTVLSTACLIASACTLLLVSRWILDGQTYGVGLALAASLSAVGLFAHEASHTLWGRVDFVSQLIWVELIGTYESAQVHVGNQFFGNVHSAKNVINIEAMTVRVWVSEIETVIFGKDAPRQLIRMRGVQEKADALAAGLKSFGESRSMVVAPTAKTDIYRAQQIGVVHQVVVRSKPDAVPVAHNKTGEVRGPLESPNCARCQATLIKGANFCGECGQKVVTPSTKT